MNRNLCGVLVVLLACSVIGCGNEHGTPVAVSGKVTLGGKPIEKARIIFHASGNKLPAELRTLKAELAPDGTYSFKTVYLADYTVMLESTEAPDATKSAIPEAGPLTPYGVGSPLKAKVSADVTTFDFKLPASQPAK